MGYGKTWHDTMHDNGVSIFECRLYINWFDNEVTPMNVMNT